MTGNSSLRRYWERVSTLAKLTIVAVCVVLLAAAAYGVRTMIPAPTPVNHDCMRSSSTILIHSGPNAECVGFTDGSYVFDPSLSGIEHAIQGEDRQVAHADPTDSVAIVVLLPFKWVIAIKVPIKIDGLGSGSLGFAGHFQFFRRDWQPVFTGAGQSRQSKRREESE